MKKPENPNETDLSTVASESSFGTASGLNRIKYTDIHAKSNGRDHKTKIICTMGPTCWEVDNLVRLLDAGMNIARLNFSHGNHKAHGDCVKRIREALSQRPNLTCAIMLDTKGPEIRTGAENKDDARLNIVRGSTIEVTTDYTQENTDTLLACSYKSLCATVKVGQTILVADGNLTLKVTEIKEESVLCEAMNDMEGMGKRKNMNLPGCIVDLPTLTEQDESDIVDFGIPQNVDMIAASFVRRVDDIEYIRNLLGPRGEHIKIMAKIENQEGLENYYDIVKSADAIMVA
jgi:pyruvate kinase